MQQGIYLVEYFPFLAEKNGRQLFSILSIKCAASVGQCHQCQERAKKVCLSACRILSTKNCCFACPVRMNIFIANLDGTIFAN